MILTVWPLSTSRFKNLLSDSQERPSLHPRFAWMIWAFFTFGPLLLLLGCTHSASSPPVQVASLIDAHYQMQQIEFRPNRDFPGPGISFYQGHLGPLLGSQCRLFPNDSRYAQILFGQCDSWRVIPHVMARFLSEPDAVRLGLPWLIGPQGISFKDLPHECP